jgi:ArsR family transcriptional regulator
MARKNHGLSLHDAVGLFESLADRTRLRITLLLAIVGELHGKELCERLDMSQPSVSTHLKRQRMGRLAEYRRAGKFNYYRLSTPVVADLLRLVCDQGLLECPD